MQFTEAKAKICIWQEDGICECNIAATAVLIPALKNHCSFFVSSQDILRNTLLGIRGEVQLGLLTYVLNIDIIVVRTGGLVEGCSFLLCDANAPSRTWEGREAHGMTRGWSWLDPCPGPR